MYDAIYFPNLGIHFQNVGQSFSILGLEITYYGVVIGIGMLLGVFVATKEAKRTNQNQDHYYDLAMFGVILSVMGARVYYVIFRWDSYKNDLLSIFNLRLGGLAIYGGIITATIVMIVYSRIKKLNMYQVFDTIAPAFLIGQVVGRIGNFFNREVFGEYTNNIFAMQLPLERVRNSDVTSLMREHLIDIEGMQFIQVHPTFLYECLWNLGLFVLIWLYRKHKKFEGELFLIYLFGYGMGRIWIEGVRTDQLLIQGTNLPVSQVLSGVLMVVTGVLLGMQWKKLRTCEKESL